MKANSYKRILSYLLDMIIIVFVSTLLTAIIPLSDEYETQSKELLETMNSYSKGEISQTEYLDKVNDVSYTVSKEGVPSSIVLVVVSTVYFVVIAYHLDGQTLGKKIMNLKIVSNNNKKLTLNNFFIRSLIIDSLLMNAVGIILIILLDKKTYFVANDIISNLFSAILLVSFTMILFKKDGRGLHDIIANTKVISTNREIILESEKEKNMEIIEDKKIEEAEIIGK